MVTAPRAQISALEQAHQISNPKSTVAVKKGDLREERNWAGFSLLLQLLETLGAGCGDDADEGGRFPFPLNGNFSLQQQI